MFKIPDKRTIFHINSQFLFPWKVSKFKSFCHQGWQMCPSFVTMNNYWNQSFRVYRVCRGRKEGSGSTSWKKKWTHHLDLPFAKILLQFDPIPQWSQTEADLQQNVVFLVTPVGFWSVLEPGKYQIIFTGHIKVKLLNALSQHFSATQTFVFLSSKKSQEGLVPIVVCELHSTVSDVFEQTC